MIHRQKRVLILGGTGDAKELARRLAESDLEVITSLAGRTHLLERPSGTVRTGGFGGVAGLTDYLQEQQVDCLIDATHPFAAQISFHAAAAAEAVNIPHLILLRPAWEKVEGDRWLDVDSHATAAATLPGLAPRIFLAIGRQELTSYVHLKDLWFLMRMVEPPLLNVAVPPGEILVERGPFSPTQESSLLLQYEIGAIVSKNSGGDATYAKIAAARELNIPVVMIQRPPIPEGNQVSDLDSVLQWVKNRLN
jgi:precorrin-6A/cobalt-precorrin-6A reductase